MKFKDLPGLIIDDLKNKPWPPGTTTADKNEYRMCLVGLLCAAGAALMFVFPWAAVVPFGIAIWKVKIILTDK